MSLALQYIGAIDAGAVHADKQFVSFRFRYGPCLYRQCPGIGIYVDEPVLG
ncbi:MAG: hypothetical protein Hals2KO_40450 [Halioglobus sp.]